MRRVLGKRPRIDDNIMLMIPAIRRKSRPQSVRRDARVKRGGLFAGESLEIRNLLAATAWPGLVNPVVDVDSNETIDVAQPAGILCNDSPLGIVGTVGADDDVSNDVDWFQFTLDVPGQLQLAALAGDDGFNSEIVLTLYGGANSEYDPELPFGHPLLGRSEASFNEAARIRAALDVGTYFVAVSGAGNRFFHPYLADSGTAGIAGDYGVTLTLSEREVALGPENSRLRPNGGFDSQFESETSEGDDTAETASELGDLTNAGRIQILGAIGDDPFYSVESEDPFATNPASDVDMFRFTIEGDGQFSLVVEAYAGRIGSALDPALTLFRRTNGLLEQIATNNNTLNPATTSNGYVPLFSDSALFVGLTEGEYFLAVSSSGNDAEYGPDGVFDPQVAHSGINGASRGDYVLDLIVAPDSTAPRVIGHVFSVPGVGEVTLREDMVESILAAPTHFWLQFNEPVNVQQLAHTAFMLVNSSTVRSVFLQDSAGQRYFPRMSSYDPTSGTAEFMMLDGLPADVLELHVSGAEGLTDLAGRPIVGNDTSGDHVLRFRVNGAERGFNGDATTWSNQPGNDSIQSAQNLGVLFPHELQAGVTFLREASSESDRDDVYRFQLLQHQNYFFSLTNLGGTAAPRMELFDASGQPIAMNFQGDGLVMLGALDPGEYYLHVGTWDADFASGVAYRIAIVLGGVSENPTPLTNGASPAVGIQLGGSGQAVIVTPRSTMVASQDVVDRQTPSGLNNNLAALPVGLSVNSMAPATAGSNENRIVRLFGFSDRDRLFSMIDSIMWKASTTSDAGTRAELTDAELTEILESNRDLQTSDEVEGSTPSDPATDEVQAETSNTQVDAPSDTHSSESSSTSQDSRRSTRPQKTRARSLEVRPADSQQPSATAAPLVLAMAARLAVTLRERARRERELVADSTCYTPRGSE